MYTNGDDRKYRAYLRKYILENAPYRVDNNGRRIYKVDDSHVTRFGGWLRKTNLDELPQLFNVLKGEMSFIGPRPDIFYALGMYKDWHLKRLDATPGITGLWQVYGRKGLSFEDMVRLDITYIEKQSPLLDAKILLSTIGTILRMDGS
jgi:lipopolysaccharide/colanic/teichoic acid biosynthesis glycosyltransferase